MEKLNDSTSKERQSPEIAGKGDGESNKTKSVDREKSVYQITPTKRFEPESMKEESLVNSVNDDVQVTPNETRNDAAAKPKTPRNNGELKSTPSREIDGAVGSGVKTRSQTKKTVTLANDVNLDSEFKKLNLESTPKISDPSGIKGTPMRPNSARTRTNRQTSQKSDDDGRPKSAGSSHRTRRRKDDLLAKSSPLPNYPSRDPAPSSLLQQQQQSASPALPQPNALSGNRKRPNSGQKNGRNPATSVSGAPPNQRGNFKQRWGKPFRGRRSSSGKADAEDNPGTASTNNVSASSSTPSAPATSTPNSASSSRNDNPRNSADRRRRRRSTKSDSDAYSVGALDDILRPLVKTFELQLPTGLIHDDRMLRHFDESNHCVEKPERLSAIYDKFCSYGLTARCDVMEAREATEEEIGAFHDQDLVEKMKLLKEGVGRKEAFGGLTDTHNTADFNVGTWAAAHFAAGGSIDAVDKVVAGQWKNAFVLFPPPGQHAAQSDFAGFSFFNDAVLAAKHAIDNLGVRRVLIVDWGVHHGNGIQEAFYDDPHVLYFSTHRYMFGTFWPMLRESDYDHIGHAEGLGYNVNVPLNKAGLGDSDYLHIVFQILLPLMGEFCPELILVSAGFDSAVGDPIGEMCLTPSFFSVLTHYLASFAHGKVVVLLKGGCFLPSISECAAAILKALLGDPCLRLRIHSKPDPLVADVVHNLKCVLRPHWQCFSPITLASSSQRRRSTSDSAASAILAQTPLPRSQKHDQITFKSSHGDKPPYYPANPLKETTQGYTDHFEGILKESLSFHHRHLPHPRSASSRVSGTSVVYDSAMKRHRNAVDPSHPEKPDRISSIYSELSRFGLLKSCHHVDSRLATEAELSLCHSQNHINEMRATKTTNGRDLHNLQSSFNSVYLNQSSYDCARLSCGCLLNVVDDVVNERRCNGMAIIRPPGHHAENHTACGFCLFNNVAVAARYAQVKYGERCKKVLILDWDVHHGNGTQHIFEDDSSVLYISLHRHDDGAFFPGNDDGDLDQIGVGRGAGFNVNVPWNTYNGRRSVGDAAYLSAFLEVVMPIATQFDPDLVLVSAGFDAAMGDPLGKCQVTPMAFARMTKFLSTLAEGRVILALEGGYNLKSISECMTACAAALLGCPLPRLPETVYKKALHHQDRTAIEKVRERLMPYWSFLDSEVAEDVADEDENLNDSPTKAENLKFDDIADSSVSSLSTDENRNRRPKSESDDLADVFQSLTIESDNRQDVSDSKLSTTPTTNATNRLDPGLKIKMAELDLKLAQVPAVVTPEVQEEAKHLIRVLVLGPEGAKAYEEAEVDGEGTGANVVTPSVPLVAPDFDESIASDAEPKMTLPVQEPISEDSGILEVGCDDSEMKVEEA